MKQPKKCYATTRKAWRAWLEKNHEKESAVHLVKYKKDTKKQSIPHRDAMHEAICFGWIDTTIKRLDDEKYLTTFVKRKENASWSKNTLGYAKQLIKEGNMTHAGMKAYERGLKKPPIDHGLPRNPKTPPDLRKELKKINAASLFKNLAPSTKRHSIYWIERAKRPETRKRRIELIARQAAKGQKPILAPDRA
ncbi:MAG: YdeI/OmpD-associated family protein [Nanoarchaeota archaeon]